MICPRLPTAKPKAMVWRALGSYPGISRPLTCAKSPALPPISSAAFRVPLARRFPKPSLRQICSNRLKTCSESPNRNCFCGSKPFSEHSMAKAIVAPAEIVSRPNQSHKRAAFKTAFGKLPNTAKWSKGKQRLIFQSNIPVRRQKRAASNGASGARISCQPFCCVEFFSRKSIGFFKSTLLKIPSGEGGKPIKCQIL